MNYQNMNTRVVQKYLGCWSVARARGYAITCHNRHGKPMFTVRPSGRVFRGNEELTTLLQASVMFKSTVQQTLNFIRLNQESYK